MKFLAKKFINNQKYLQRATKKKEKNHCNY